MSIYSGVIMALSERYGQEYVQRSTFTRCTLPPRNGLQVVPSTQETRARQELDDEELMAEIRLGAEWAMEVLYQRYYKYVYALAYRILRDNVIADDIVQEVFLAAWHKAASYRELRGSVRTWLLTITRHRAIDSVRAAMSRDYQYTSLQGREEQDLPGREPELWEEAWHQERDAILHRRLAQLPMKQRQAIELRYFDGFTDVEIANHLHVPLGTVKGRIRLGLRKMKQLLCDSVFEAEISG
jgi:RNA polymerase sigma-70 factor (ECF subfamily)